MMSLRSQDGYVALITILVVGAASVAIAVTLLTFGTDSQREALVERQSAQATSQAASCAEEALQQIHDNTAYTGTGNLVIGVSSCTYTVANTGGSTRTVDAASTAGNVVRKIKVYVTINASSLSVTSWQDVN